MKNRLAVVGLAASLVLAFPVAAVAGDGPEHSKGNHGAVWSLSVDEHGLTSGTEWGPMIKMWATGEILDKDGGVSCGVHLAKGLKIQEKCE